MCTDRQAVDKAPLIKWVRIFLRYWALDDWPGYVSPDNPAQIIIDTIINYQSARESGKKNLEGLLPDVEYFFLPQKDRQEIAQ